MLHSGRQTQNRAPGLKLRPLWDLGPSEATIAIALQKQGKEGVTQGWVSSRGESSRTH